ncbi:MAG: hypothetical protein ACRDZO_05865, partial [Egibacteraceae bacterium]
MATGTPRNQDRLGHWVAMLLQGISQLQPVLREIWKIISRDTTRSDAPVEHPPTPSKPPAKASPKPTPAPEPAAAPSSAERAAAAAAASAAAYRKYVLADTAPQPTTAAPSTAAADSAAETVT